MAQEVLQVSRRDGYAVLTLNRPEKRNALNQALLSALDEALTSLEGDKSIRAILINGAGRVFCSGIDLREVNELEGVHNPASIERVFAHLERFPVPTIAAVQGAALAGGLELALHCDLRVAAEGTKLGMTIARVGLVVPFPFTRKLIEIIGAAYTNQILFTAQPIDAQRALEIGMVHQVVPESELENAATALVQTVAGNAPLSLRAMKATIRRCMSAAFDAEHADIDALAREVRKSHDAKEGVRAFLEKRKPNWQAR